MTSSVQSGLAALTGLADKATPGPWGTDGDQFSHGIRPADEEGVCIIAEWRTDSPCYSQDVANAAYLAALPPELTKALARVAEAAHTVAVNLGMSAAEKSVSQEACALYERRLSAALAELGPLLPDGKAGE